MRYRYLKIAILVSIVWLTSSAAPSSAQMPTGAASPEFGSIEFENEAITVVRMHMAPHERTPMHDIASPRLVIWLTDARLRDTGPDGRVSEYNRPAGSIDWVTPRRHMGENLGDHGLDFWRSFRRPPRGRARITGLHSRGDPCGRPVAGGRRAKPARPQWSPLQLAMLPRPYRLPTSANMAPCGSLACTIQLPPGTSIGPLMTSPPPAFRRSTAASKSPTLK